MKYNFLPKYCKTYRLQGHDKALCRVLCPKLRKWLTKKVGSQDENDLKNNKIHVESPIFRVGNISKKWHPTTRKFPRQQPTIVKSNDQIISNYNTFAALSDESLENHKQVNVEASSNMIWLLFC